MSAQDFDTIASGAPSLLEEVELIVLAAHRDAWERAGTEWSRAIAYRWIRYEDPLPVERLREAVEKLQSKGARFDAAAVEKACTEAAKRGFSN